MVGAVVLWLITGSAFMLAFAALGPIASIAQRFDARRAERRRTAEQQLASEAAATLEQEAAFSAERAACDEAWASLRTVFQLIEGAASPAFVHSSELVLGAGCGLANIASQIPGSGSVGTGFPVRVAECAAIAISGPSVLRAALRRSIEVQAYSGGQQRSPLIVREFDTPAELDGSTEVLVDLAATDSATLWRRGEAPTRFRPHLLGVQQYATWKRSQPEPKPPPGSNAPISCGIDAAAEPVPLDLWAAPHALVAGVTGSGKTELLRAWVAALCEQFGPHQLALVVLDYKGGSGFADLWPLPQLAALCTDLDDSDITRCAVALRSELARREATLARAGLRNWEALPSDSAARLVVIIDEYQLLVERSPELHSVFADMAARGRALGVHLVLCTQHPGQVVRDQILANCGLRICLRVLDPAQSQAIIGTAAAAELGAAGAVVSRSEHGLLTWRVQPLDRTRREQLIARWGEHPRAEAPWLTPIPASLSVAVARSLIPDADAALAVRDLVAERRYEALGLSGPVRLRVIGPSGSGRSAALDRIAELSAASGYQVRYCLGRPADRWQLLASLEPAAHTVLLLDDLDDALLSFDPDYRPLVLERLREWTREPRANIVWTQRGPTVLDDFLPGVLQLTAQPGCATWRGAPAQLILPQAARPDARELIAEVPLWQPNGPTIVVTRSPERFVARATERGWHAEPLGPGVRGREALERFRDAGPEEPAVLCGDPEHWISLGAEASAALASARLLFADGRLSDYRVVSRRTTLPPLIESGEGWLIEHGNAPARTRLPWSSGG